MAEKDEMFDGFVGAFVRMRSNLAAITLMIRSASR